MTRSLLQFAALVFAILFVLPATLRADEASDAFLVLWKQQADQPTPAAAWAGFASKNPNHALASSAQLLVVIDHLRHGDAKVALAAVEPLAVDPAADSPDARKLTAAAAKGLIARARMMILAGKLKDYYRKHVEYPAALDELLKEKLAIEADLGDPFGQRFAYDAKPRKSFPNVPRQVFTLTCTTTKAKHDELAAVLERARQPIKTLTLSSADPAAGQAFLKRSRPDGTPGPSQRYAVGQEIGDVTLWGIYSGYVVVGWREFPVVVIKE